MSAIRHYGWVLPPDDQVRFLKLFVERGQPLMVQLRIEGQGQTHGAVWLTVAQVERLQAYLGDAVQQLKAWQEDA